MQVHKGLQHNEHTTHLLDTPRLQHMLDQEPMDLLREQIVVESKHLLELNFKEKLLLLKLIRAVPLRLMLMLQDVLELVVQENLNLVVLRDTLQPKLLLLLELPINKIWDTVLTLMGK